MILQMINDGTNAPYAIPRNTFDGIFGQGFSTNHTFLYYTVEGFYKYFIFSFVYSIFSCSIVLLSKKIYQSIIIPTCYFFGFTFLVNFFSGASATNLIVLQPTYIQGFNAFINDSPNVSTALLPLSSLIIPIITSLVLITIYIRGKEKTNEITS
jgi:hypothetical protein